MLIANKTIVGELKEAWEQRVAEKMAQTLLQKARDGDLEAMYKVSEGYRYGKYGFEQDDEAAFYWMKTGSDCGSVKCTANLGFS